MKRFRGRTSRLTPALLLLTLAPAVSGAQAPAGGELPRTRAERTGFQETSRYEEVLDFLSALAARAPGLALTTFGHTFEGRPLPLAVWGAGGADAAAVRAAGKLRVLVLANIHGGEVEGKEASLALLRGLVAGENARWADSLVLLVAPVYNADGNERLSLTHRSRQHGPVGGVGTRENGQGLDLNRDHTKLDSPEARALVRLLTEYDPHLTLDLHTTNGTHHGYHLTYSPPLHPNTDPAIERLLRDRWLPEVRRTMRQRHGWETYDYGNVPSAESPWAAPRGAERAWYTFDHRPRFNNNYVGLRNRFVILSEAYSYLPFRERIAATYDFVSRNLDFAHAHASEIRAATAAADARPLAGRELALRARPRRSARMAEILLGTVVEDRNPYSGETMLRRGDTVRRERMPEFVSFEATETVAAPAAYLVPPELVAVRERLVAHGVAFRVLPRAALLRAERFRIDSVRVAGQPFQGRLEQEVWGGYESAEVAVPAGTLLVPVGQPLGRLVFTLLEPRSDDGFVNWGLLDQALPGADYLPVLRTTAPPLLDPEGARR
jgi:hypothetical protein